MAELKLGVQLMTIKKYIDENGPYEALKKLNDLGFKYVEISQIEMNDKNIQELNRAFLEFEMEAIAISAPLYRNEMAPNAPFLLENIDVFIEQCKKLNCSYIRIGMIPFSLMDDKEGLKKFAKDMENVAQELGAKGIKLYYHNHHIEFCKLEGDYIFDILKEGAPSIGYELDIHWIQRGGFNPVNLINKLNGKVDLLHLKDYKVQPLNIKDFDFSKLDTFMNTFTGNIKFAEVGEGNLEVDKIIDAGIASNVEFYIIEQDDTYGKDPFECLKTSKNNLDRIMETKTHKFI